MIEPPLLIAEKGPANREGKHRGSEKGPPGRAGRPSGGRGAGKDRAGRCRGKGSGGLFDIRGGGKGGRNAKTRQPRFFAAVERARQSGRGHVQYASCARLPGRARYRPAGMGAETRDDGDPAGDRGGFPALHTNQVGKRTPAAMARTSARSADDRTQGLQLQRRLYGAGAVSLHSLTDYIQSPFETDF